MSRKQPDEASPPGDDHPVRIAKAMARAGLTSRRDAEAWIAAGRVAVNGETITTPAVTVTARDKVTVDGAPLPERERTRLFLYYKPVGLVTTNADPEGRPTIFAALPTNLPRLVSVGRLDIATEGLLLLTNDGGLARVLELPATGWVRRYRVRAHGRVEPAALERLRGGITIDGIHYGPIEATLDRDLGTNVWLTIAIREGKNREVRNVVEALGLQANRLIRVSFGPFQLGDMRDGEVLEVKTRVLRDQLGEHVIAEAGCDFSSPVAVREEADERAPPRAERVRRDQRAEPVTRSRRDERPAPREERPRRREDARSPGEDRPAPRRDERDRRAGARDGRPQRRDRDEGPQPRGRQDERFRRRRPDDRDAAEKPAGRPRRGHAWRSDDAPLGRHYRGAGSKARQLPDEPERPKRAGLIADRKGRRVLVERFGAKPAASPTSPHEGEVGAKRREGGRFGPRGNKDTPRPTAPPQGRRERSRTDRNTSSEAGERPQRRPFTTSPHEGEVGARRREAGRVAPRGNKDTPRPTAPPQGRRERSRTDRNTSSGAGERPNRPAGKPTGYGSKKPHGRGGKPGPRDRPRGTGPRPSRPGSPKRR